MDQGWRMQFTFHGQPHTLPKVKLDRIGELEPRTLYKAAFGGPRPASVEQSLRKSFLCQAYVRLLDLAGENIFLNGKRVTRKQCIDTFKLHQQWDELGLASTTTQREREGGRLPSQPDRPPISRHPPNNASYLPRDDPAGFPVLRHSHSFGETGMVTSHSPSPQTTSPIISTSITSLERPSLSANGIPGGTGEVDKPRHLLDCMTSAVGKDVWACLTPMPGGVSKALLRHGLESTIDADIELRKEATDILPPLRTGSLALTPARPPHSNRVEFTSLADSSFPRNSCSPPTVDDSSPRGLGVGCPHNGHADQHGIATRSHRGTQSWPATMVYDVPRQPSFVRPSVQVSDGLGFASYRDRRSTSWSTVDAMLTAAMLGPTSDMASTPSPSKDPGDIDSPSRIEDSVGLRALHLTTILQGQAQELQELKRALARGPSGISDSIRAALRLEAFHKSAIGEVQLLRGLGKEYWPSD